MKKIVCLARKNRLGGHDLLVLYLYGTLIQFNLFLFFHNAVFFSIDTITSSTAVSAIFYYCYSGEEGGGEEYHPWLIAIFYFLASHQY